MELNTHYGGSDTAKEIFTEIASRDNRTEQGRIYDTLQHGTGELADKTTPSAKKCTRCTLVNSILIGLLIIAVSVSLYMSINVSKASNSKAGDLQKLLTTLSQKIDKLEHAQGQIQTEILQNTNRLNETRATVTGIWTNWSDWSPCNAKCGQGFKWRMRTCTSVSPIDNGFGCNGNGTETVQCQNRECSADLQKLVTTLSQKINKIEHAQGQIQTEVLQNTNRLNKTTDLQKLVTTQSQKIDKLEHAQGQIQSETLQNTNKLNEANVSVGFAVRNPDTNSSGSRLKFSNVIYNSGDDYNVSSGVFTCRHPGLYFFTATFFRSPGLRESGCYFSINGIRKLGVYSGPGANDGYQSGSGSIVYHLKAGDIVNLSNCRGIDHMNFLSSFTGFRVSY